MTFDCFWADGLDGPATIVAAGRDLATAAEADPLVLDRAELRSVLTQPAGEIADIESTDSSADLAPLRGSTVSAGFRRAVQNLAGVDRSGILYRLLQCLPGAHGVGGLVLVRAGVPPFTARDLLSFENVCRGWRTGGVQMRESAAGVIPMLTGPAPTPLDDPADPLAWHPTAPALWDSVRRSRRLDVWREEEDLVIDAHHRDSYLALGQPPMVVHEYSLRARADATSQELTSISTKAHALPWSDCDSVVNSTDHVLGVRLGALDEIVRTKLRGTAGCTHLNDTLRDLDMVPALSAALPTRA